MSQEERQSELREKTRQLLQGPLKHVRVIGLAAALLPVAAVPAAAAARNSCSSGGNFCGFVFNDLNGNGIQDAGEPGIAGLPSYRWTAVARLSDERERLLRESFAPGRHVPASGADSKRGRAVSEPMSAWTMRMDSDGMLSGPNSVVTIIIAGVSTGNQRHEHRLRICCRSMRLAPERPGTG